MINSNLPDSWQDLQNDVAQILNECGLVAGINKTIDTVRGSVAIDVFATDSSQTPAIINLCECKHWNSNVPKREVHAFRTIVNDYGANWGLIISKIGFQSGAYEVAQHTNLKLFNWIEFQSLFAERWYREYMLPKLNKETDPFLEYTEPINSRIFRAVDSLSLQSQKFFTSLRRKHNTLSGIFSLYVFQLHGAEQKLPELPLINSLTRRQHEEYSDIPEDILTETSLRGLLEAILRNTNKAIAEFDEVFGKRV